MTQKYSDPSLIANLTELYNFRDPQAVVAFIESHSFLVSLLVDAERIIRKYFGLEPLFLEIYPEMEASDKDQLVIFIATKLNAREASQNLDNIDQEWWLANLDNTKGKLSINLEFR